jgi:hypothetical protein
LRMRLVNRISDICGRNISNADSVLVIFTSLILFFAYCRYVCLYIVSQIQISFAYTGHINKQLQVGRKMHFKLWRISEKKSGGSELGTYLRTNEIPVQERVGLFFYSGISWKETLVSNESVKRTKPENIWMELVGRKFLFPKD